MSHPEGTRPGASPRFTRAWNAGFFKSRTLRAGDIKLNDSGFECDGTHYPFKSVISLRYHYVATRYTVNFWYKGTDYDAQLDIYIRKRPEPISIRTRKRLFNYHLEFDASEVQKLYLELAPPTFESRLARYTRQIEKRGYFEYDKKQILRNGDVSDGKRTTSLFDGMTFRAPFELYKERPNTFANRLIDFCFGSGVPFISTQYDADVFFWILDQYCGLSWSSQEVR